MHSYMPGQPSVHIVVAIVAVATVAAQEEFLPVELPAAATTKLSQSLEAAGRHASHVWRDTPAANGDGTINGYVEITRGDRRKWELDMGSNERVVDRVIPEAVGGVPVNYGFVPQTMSYDGDPLDILVLGPPIPGGSLLRGVVVGLMLMEDEKGLDSKVVVAEPDETGRARYQLTEADQRRIGDYFNAYKREQPGMFSRVPGWRSASEGLRSVRLTHAFFNECRNLTGHACRVSVQ